MLKKYKCSVCGNIVELLVDGSGQLVCCGQPMELLEAKTQEEGKEKHIPMVEKTGSGLRVKVGSINHPMDPAHYIQWIELEADGKFFRKMLSPSEEPVAEFDVVSENPKAAAYCNVHGLWQG